MGRGRRLATWTSALAFVVSACTSNGGGGGPEEDRAYLDGVRAAQTIRDDAVRSLTEALSIAYPTRGRLFQVAGDIEFQAATEEALDAAARLTPPAHFQDDHESWVQSMRETLRLFNESQEALEREDMVDMVVGFMRTEVDLAERLPGWSEEFCRAAFPANFEDEGADALCLRGDSIAGGEYGQALYETVLRAQLEVGRRIGLSGLPAFSDEQELEYLGIIQPEVEQVLGRALETVRGLQPSEELRADHDAVVRFYEGILQSARRITAAAERGDRDELESSYEASLEPGAMLKQQLSEQGGSIIGMFHFFSEDEGP